MPLARAVRTCSSASCSIIEARAIRVYCAVKMVAITSHGMHIPMNQPTGSSVIGTYCGFSIQPVL